MKTHDENDLPHQDNKVCSPKEGGKFTTIWRFSSRPDLANNLIDSGTIADEIQRKFSGGGDKVLEMNGTVTLEDSLHCDKQCGIVCMTGLLAINGHSTGCTDGSNPDWCLSHGIDWRVCRFYAHGTQRTGTPD